MEKRAYKGYIRLDTYMLESFLLIVYVAMIL